MLFGPGVMHVLTAKSAIAKYSISWEFPVLVPKCYAPCIVVPPTTVRTISMFLI